MSWFAFVFINLHDLGTKIGEPDLEQFAIERRRVTTRYHGSPFFGMITKGSLGNNDGDGNENGKNEISLY